MKDETNVTLEAILYEAPDIAFIKASLKISRHKDGLRERTAVTCLSSLWQIKFNSDSTYGHQSANRSDA